MPGNPHSYLESIQQAGTTAQQALERVIGPVLGALSQPEIEDVLAGTASAEAHSAATAISEARDHAGNAALLLTRATGELAAYAAAISTGPGASEGTPAAKPVTTATTEHPAQPDTRVTPESTPHTTPQPEYALEFSPEEFQALIAKIGTLKVIKRDKLYEIPGHPDKILRTIPMCMYTNNRLATSEQNREHMRKYEAELVRLQACGIPILRRATYIDDNPADGELPMLYTVVERHPDGTDFLTLAKSVNDDPAKPGTLYAYRTVVRRLMEAMKRYARETTALGIGDLASIRQFATDGTLLDYDPELFSGKRIKEARYGDWQDFIRDPLGTQAGTPPWSPRRLFRKNQ